VTKSGGYSKYDAQLYPCNISRYARFSSATGLDSVARPTYNDDVSALSFWINVAYVPGTTSDIQESIKNGADADTVQGRYSPKTIYRKKNSIYTISHDLLGDHKNHTLSPLFLKLLGLTMEISQLNHSLAYNLSDTSHYGLYDFIYSTYNIHALTKGKWFKKILGMKDFIDMDCYIELYPVDIERCTVDEYKERKKDRSCVSFKYSENMLPLSSAVQNLVDRVNREIPVK
jgi:hypothetical protein